MTNKQFYKDKVVLITGGSIGIGKELARQCLLLGAKVVITARNAERLQAAQLELSLIGDVLAIEGDVSNLDWNITTQARIKAHFGKLDVLITNAGLSAFGEVAHTKPGVFKEVIDTNIYGSLFPAMLAIPELKKTGGSILFISSIAGFQGLPGYSAYSLSKMSLKALAQSMNAELKKTSVFVGIAYVGFTENESQKKTMTASGEWVDVPQRPKLLTSTRTQTSQKILNQIKDKKFSVVHSALGKTTSVLNRLIPSIMRRIMKKNYSPNSIV